MKQSRKALVEALGQKSLKVTDFKQFATEIAAYLLQEGRVSELEPIMRDMVVYRSQHGIVEADVVSAHPVTTEVLKDAEKLLHQTYPDVKRVHVTPRVQPEVVGGVRVVMPHEQLDMTVRSQLSTFKQKLTS